MAIATGDLGKASLTVNGVHDSTIAYEKLCLVSANGISYVSKKAVPVGISIGNTEYWMPMTDDAAAAASAAAAAIAARNAISYISDIFDETQNYSAGEYVIYDGVFYKFTANHTAGAWDSTEVTVVTAGSEMEEILDQLSFLRNTLKFQVRGNISAGSTATFTDSRINSDHWRVPENGISYGTSSNVASEVHWSTNISNHTITLSGTFSGPTTVNIDMEWYQDIL